MKKLTFLLAIGYVLVFSTPLVWGQLQTSPVAHTPADYNSKLEGYGLKLVDPEKCPSGYVTVIAKDKYSFGTSVVAYSPADANRLLEAYGLKLKDPQKCPSRFFETMEKDKYTFATNVIAFSKDEVDSILEAYGVQIKK